MPKQVTALLDQNISIEIRSWLLSKKPEWKVLHTADVGLNGASDEAIYRWAQDNQALIISFDEDFADSRLLQLGSHSGIIRLKVWPTTSSEVKRALTVMFASLKDDEIHGALIIIDQNKIRVRRSS